MPARMRKSRRRRVVRVTPEAVELFSQGLRDPHNRDVRINLAAALGRSKFAASPLDSEPRSLIGGDREPVEVALELRAELMKKINKGT